jgi:translation initiation factor IF-2
MEAAEMRLRKYSLLAGMSLDEKSDEKLPSRPPVVTIMGQVEHGKSTLKSRLRIRGAEAKDMAAKETKRNNGVHVTSKKGALSKKNQPSVGNTAVGIGASDVSPYKVTSSFQVSLPHHATTGSDGLNFLTFLDIPNKAELVEMTRQAGSSPVDIIVLVIAADDGVCSQTIDIINAYKSIARAQPDSISMVVAMTKIDKPDIDVYSSLSRIENELAQHEIFSERLATSSCEFDAVPIFPLSGMTGEGVGDLVEGLISKSEIMDLRACRECRAEGVVMDAKVGLLV